MCTHPPVCPNQQLSPLLPLAVTIELTEVMYRRGHLPCHVPSKQSSFPGESTAALTEQFQVDCLLPSQAQPAGTLITETEQDV